MSVLSGSDNELVRRALRAYISSLTDPLHMSTARNREAAMARELAEALEQDKALVVRVDDITRRLRELKEALRQLPEKYQGRHAVSTGSGLPVLPVALRGQ